MDDVSTEAPLITVTSSPVAGLPGNVFPVKGVILYLYLFWGGLGLLGNGLSMVVLARQPQLRKKLANLFLIHQSVIDFLTSLLLVSSTLTVRPYHLDGSLGHFLCVVWQNLFLLWSLYTVSTYNLCALSIEQYLAVVHPLRHKVAFTHAKAGVVMFSAWVLGFGLTSFTPITSGLIGDACYKIYFWPTNLTRRAVGVFNIVMRFFLPLAVMVFTYGRILILLRMKINAPVGHQVSQVQEGSHFSTAKRNTIKMLVIVCACFVLCWVWNQVYFLALNLGAGLSLNTPFFHFTVVAVFSNCCINPVIYLLKYREYRRGLRQLLAACYWPRSHRVDADTTGTGPVIINHIHVQET